ncbi:MAG TPA: CRTAC1 family protein, partial [Thermoanaerobaculia bacterium]|nr:CRTAC1 family protein [Thermoanaerobaculia bacterium]
AGAAAEVVPYPSAAETRAELEAVCARLTEGDSPYFGRRIVPALRDRVETGDEASSHLMRLRLIYELIRLGHHDEALEQVARGLARLDEAESPHEGQYRYRYMRDLGIAHLQLAEDQNCIADHHATSCILPFTPQAVHQRPEHARRAGDAFAAITRQNPDETQSRWLLNLARMLSGDYPEGVPEPLRLPAGVLPAPAPGGPVWKDLAAEVGIDAFDLSGGAIMDDFDGDGLLDLVSSSWDPCEPAKAYRNTGRGDFENVSDAWGLSAQLGGLNLIHTDYDGDGMLDLMILRGGWLGDDGRVRNSLLRNDLKRPAGRFVDVTAAAGVAYPAFPTQAGAWADYDRDGDLDLYLGNEATAQSTDPLSLYGRTGNPFPSQLFRNNGDGTFTDVARAAGVANTRFAKGVAWGDYDDDGWPDLYVSNIGPNRLYRNLGDGTFSDVAPALGVDQPEVGTFPTWFFDFDNDGDLDLFVASFSAPVYQVSASYLGEATEGGHPVLYRNDGGRFTDVSAEVGLTRPLLVMGANYGELDGDGYPDLYLGTGVPDYDALMPNAAYRNDRGHRFEDVTFTTGLGHLQKGHGVAFGDVDNDGRQEIFQQLGGAFPYDAYGNALYDAGEADHRWLTLRLVGRGANRFAVGARVEVRVREAGAIRSVHTLVGPGGSFGGSSLQQEIGLGQATAIELVRIRWPGVGRAADPVQEFRGVALDRAYQAVEGEPELVPIELAKITLGGAPDAGPDHRHSSEDTP